MKKKTHHRCPYCNYAFRKLPKHGSKCPHCDQKVWFKLAPGEKKKRLVTTGQGIRIDMAWRNLDIENNCGLDSPTAMTIKLELPKPQRPLISLSGDEILKEIKKSK